MSFKGHTYVLSKLTYVFFQNHIYVVSKTHICVVGYEILQTDDKICTFVICDSLCVVLLTTIHSFKNTYMCMSNHTYALQINILRHCFVIYLYHITTENHIYVVSRNTYMCFFTEMAPTDDSNNTWSAVFCVNATAHAH